MTYQEFEYILLYAWGAGDGYIVLMDNKRINLHRLLTAGEVKDIDFSCVSALDQIAIKVHGVI